MKKLSLNEKIICNKIYKVFEKIAVSKHWYEPNIINEWLKSKTLAAIIDEDETVICQSYIYLYNDIISELNYLPVHKEYTIDKMSLSWLAYLIMYWLYQDNITPNEIIKDYDISEILTQYDPLHTLSIKTAISYIKENYKKSIIIKDKLFNS